MNLSDITGYLSQYQGDEVDAAVGRVQGIDTELANKVNKTTTINGHALETDIVLTAEDVGALSGSIKYGKSLAADGNILSLKDQSGTTMSSVVVSAEPLVDGTTLVYRNGVLSVNTDTMVAENVDGGQLTLDGDN